MVVKAEGNHFGEVMVRGPILPGNTIGGNHHSGAIFSVVAVDEDFLLGIVLGQFEKLRHLRVGGRRPAAHGNIDEAHSQGFGLTATIPAILGCPLRRKGVEFHPLSGGSTMNRLHLRWLGLMLAALVCVTCGLVAVAADEPTLTKERSKQFLRTPKGARNKKA